MPTFEENLRFHVEARAAAKKLMKLCSASYRATLDICGFTFHHRTKVSTMEIAAEILDGPDFLEGIKMMSAKEEW